MSHIQSEAPKMRSKAKTRNQAALVVAPALFLFGFTAAAQTHEDEVPPGVTGKLQYHAQQTASPRFALQTAAYAGALHWMNVPAEWGQGWGAYGKRVASAGGAAAIRQVVAFALDSSLREDPRYRRSGRGGFFARLGHAARETVITRTDRGGSRFATWRFGSALGAACLSNVWYPDRLNTFSSGIRQAGASIGLDLFGNIANEFWPDLKQKVLRR
jgi:hypothetical protein